MTDAEFVTKDEAFAITIELFKRVQADLEKERAASKILREALEYYQEAAFGRGLQTSSGMNDDGFKAFQALAAADSIINDKTGVGP